MQVNQYKVSLVSVCLLILFCSLILQAQSGRRKTSTAPAPPVPTPTPEPSPSPKEPDKEADIVFLVGADRDGVFGGYPMSFYDAAIVGCAEKLRRPSNVRVDISDREFNRGDAIKKAKAETKMYVVLLQLTNKTMGGSQSSSYDQLEIQYTVFSPGTAKIAVSGTSYLNASRKGPLVVGPPGGSNNAIYAEHLVKQAGGDAGERILRALHIGSQI